MGRMYGQGKGISKSSMPYKKVPPRWLPIDSKEVTNLIEINNQNNQNQNPYFISVLKN